MAKKQGSRNISEVTDQQMLEELIRVHAQATGESASSILRANVETGESGLQGITVREVEYNILEPAAFVETCSTSQVVDSLVPILQQRDIQMFLNKLIGVGDLPDPDFVFDGVAISAAEELVDQMGYASVAAMAQFLSDTTGFTDCQLTLSDGRRNLASVMGEVEDSGVLIVTYHMKIGDMVKSEFIECIPAGAVDGLYQKIRTREEAEAKAKQGRREAAKQAALLGQNSIVGKGALSDADQAEGKDDEARELANARGRGTGAGPRRSGPGAGQPGAAGILYRNQTVSGNLGLIMDVPLDVSAEVGKTKRRLKDVLNFNNGTVVEFDKQVDTPMGVIINGQLIMESEVVVIDDNFGMRIIGIVNTRNTTGNGG